MPDFHDARRETIRYHDELYANASLGDEGTWLARPHPLIHEAIALVADDRPVVAYDLGAGIGRHVVPLLERLPDGSQVHAIDLLDSAVERLRALTPASGSRTLHVQRADLADVTFEQPADLIFAFSAVEHLPGTAAIGGLFARIRSALAPGGVVALGIVADRYEVDAQGERRPALLESALSTQDVDTLVADAFPDLQTVSHGTRPALVEEQRDGETYTLGSTLVTWIGRQSGAQTRSALRPAPLRAAPRSPSPSPRDRGGA
ncbi:class I SAM-dependent methyltransferase [Microbacterium sp. ARD32]|uniref:class I SAM-dependent methyltransferase n=1 Tax=Microbacterium sp. ARD32 TaxID=2962577 RepID=UPI0028814FA3|nr:class I SAM-dependent methyltransferase [Microbacterium sp. ARD32]MDT0157856.1 class I SAM-dependent methyltransferase [Microbacterium sp. ARD32]